MFCCGHTQTIKPPEEIRVVNNDPNRIIQPCAILNRHRTSGRNCTNFSQTLQWEEEIVGWSSALGLHLSEENRGITVAILMTLDLS